MDTSLPQPTHLSTNIHHEYILVFRRRVIHNNNRIRMGIWVRGRYKPNKYGANCIDNNILVRRIFAPLTLDIMVGVLLVIRFAEGQQGHLLADL